MAIFREAGRGRVGLLRLGFAAIWAHARELPVRKNWSLRHLFARTNDRALTRGTVKESLCSTGRVQLGDFKINLDQRTVTLRDQELRLTSEEFDVLLFLASHPRSLVTTNHHGDRSGCKSTLTEVPKSPSFSAQETECRQDPATTTFALNRWSYTASIQLPTLALKECTTSSVASIT